MNKNIIITCLTLLVPHLLVAQSNYRVVFDLTSKDSVNQKNVIRWINEISRSDPKALIEVVLYGQSLDLVIKDRSLAPAMISEFVANKNISFMVCRIAMKNQRIDSSMLIQGVGMVPDGIYEIISRQREGWGYIKVAH